MYSLAILTFDGEYSKDFDEVYHNRDFDENNDNEKNMYYLWQIHRFVLESFKKQSPSLYCKENYDQFGIYFELMRAIPNGSKLVNDILGYSPRLTGPSATVPSRLHAHTVDAMIDMLSSVSKVEYKYCIYYFIV